MEEILAKYFSEEATKDEITLIESWRSESEENAKSYFEAKSIWLDSQQLQAPPKDLLDEILKEETVEAEEVTLWSTSWIRYGIAASIVAALGLWFLFTDSGNVNVESTSLADGSTVALHGDSRLEVIQMDESVREVRIHGKGYFDIERDENRPFIIHTDNAIVKVLGTSFVVNSYGEDTEVCVESGLVELVKANDDVSVKLSKGELGLVSKHNKGIIKRNNDNPNYLAWKTKILTFKDASMKEVVNTIEDVYGITVKLDNPAFSSCKLTAKFNKKKPKDAIEIIARTFEIEYDYSNGVAILKGKGC
ncbi:MAG: FecR domain-containing protein [Bacteroidota bacterium]